MKNYCKFLNVLDWIKNKFIKIFLLNMRSKNTKFCRKYFGSTLANMRLSSVSKRISFKLSEM